jgi:type IV pilus biogenesis protein CpaD/CtpE
VDKQRQVNESLDADFFGTHQRNERIQGFKQEIAALEAEFLQLRRKHGEVSKLAEMMKVPEIRKVLGEIGDRKRKVQKLEFAIRDALKEAEQS